MRFNLPSSDAIVIGAGPNGLAAAITLAQAGAKVTVLETMATVGGAARTAPLTLPHFLHDVCSSVHPLAAGSPVFAAWPLERHGLQWVHPPVPLAHPFDDGTAVALHRSLAATTEGLGGSAAAYADLVGPLVRRWGEVVGDLLGPLHVPRHLQPGLHLAVWGLRSAMGLGRQTMTNQKARALLAGLGAHSCIPLEHVPTAAFALILAASAHAVGWPFARGGSQSIPDALAATLRELGGSILTGSAVESLVDLPPARAVLADLTPGPLLEIAGGRLGPLYRRRLARYRYGPGAFKIDWALEAPIPWRADLCRQAGTVHLGGPADEIAAAEQLVWQGLCPRRPFVILAQPTLFDASRAPAGNHTAWAYCHVPNGSSQDMTTRIEAQVERFAPGFSRLILARSTRAASELEAYNPNCVGGDINGGAATLRQLFFRPAMKLNPYRCGRGLFICSSATPPGGGVHGLCGHHAALAALAEM